MNSGPPAVPSDAWAVRLWQVPTRHRGVTFLRAREVALQWCASGLAADAAALGWGEVDLFGVRAERPFLRPSLMGAALMGVPRFLTDHAARFDEGRLLRRGQLGPDFIPEWCLDRRRRRPDRTLARLPSGLWIEAPPVQRQRIE